ncbi:hypothetical protein Tco_1525767 [Tanacetum coccineum]
MMKTREDYGLGIARPKIDDKAHFELKGRFLIELHDNAFSEINGEDAMEHIENFLEIVDSLNMNHKTMDEYSKNALWNYWRNGNDEEVITDSELSNPRDDNLIEENEIAQIFRIDTNFFDFNTPQCQAFKEFNYLLYGVFIK